MSDADVLAARSERSVDGCLIWTGGKFKTGYGSLWSGGKARKTHRLAWEHANGPIPAGMFVCHHCDNPSCIEPAHLFVGTAADNNADKLAKGRQPRGLRVSLALRNSAAHAASITRGEDHPNAKLTAADVHLIRESVDLHRVIAARFGVHKSTISLIKTGKKWGSLQ